MKSSLSISHRAIQGITSFILNIISAIAAYAFFPKKPSIKNDIQETNPAVIILLNQPKLFAA